MPIDDNAESQAQEARTMTEHKTDDSVLKHIDRLVAEAHRLYERGSMNATERAQLHAIQVELDQWWDLLRQRRALRDAGQDPGKAHVRSPEIVEEYEQ
jgi:hypothetical protein